MTSKKTSLLMKIAEGCVSVLLVTSLLVSIGLWGCGPEDVLKPFLIPKHIASVAVYLMVLYSSMKISSFIFGKIKQKLTD
ncbi:MAG: hypothetical protein LBU96_09520 [Yokenella regensburgei]|nr:hypothetical protein [Yokenella regensburgei]